MSTESSVDYARERQLIEKLEFRIASADSSDKLQDILQKFLPALVLKLATQDVYNRNLTIKVCQYINQRLKIDTNLQVPVEGLSKTFKSSQNAFVKQFCLMFTQLGFQRLNSDDAVRSLPPMLSASVVATSSDTNDSKLLALIIGLLLETLPRWKFPERGTDEDLTLAATFALTESQRSILAHSLSRFLLFDTKQTTSEPNYENLQPVFERAFARRSQIVPGIANFLFTSVFHDEDRFIPATILSVDANAEANSRADVMFKQCNFDLESDTLVDAAFNLWDVAKPRLQTRILTLLSRSQKSTTRVSKIVELVESQLAYPTMNLEATKLRAAIFSYLIWAVRSNKDIARVAENLLSTLKDFVELQGWPRMNEESTAAANLRAQAYESIGLLAASLKNSMSASASTSLSNLVTWLFTSLRCDTTSNIRHSIEESLSRLMNTVQIGDSSEAAYYRNLLLWNVLAKEGDADPTYFLPTVFPAQYPAVRFTNKIFEFADVNARVIDVIALSGDRKETVEEARRGLDPYWHASSSRVSGKTIDVNLPNFADFVSAVFKNGQFQAASAQIPSLASRVGALSFARVLAVTEAWQGSNLQPSFVAGWQEHIDAELRGNKQARELLSHYLAGNVGATEELLKVSLNGMKDGSLECTDFSYDILSLANNELVCRVTELGLSASSAVVENGKLQAQAARVFAIIASLKDDWEDVVLSEMALCTDWATAVGQGLVKINGSLLKAGNTLSRALLRGHTFQSETVISAWKLLKTIMEGCKDKPTRQNVYHLVGDLALASPELNQDIIYCLPPDTIMLSDAKKEIDAAIWATGRLLNLTMVQLSDDDRREFLDKLFDLHEIRKVDFHFALGEALAVAALGWQSSSTMTEFDIDSKQPSRRVHRSFFSDLLDTVLQKAQSTKPAMRKASGIWLMSLVQFCTEIDLLQPKLQACQTAFSRLLSDRDELVQEAGSRGLGMVYEKGDKAVREDLVRNLVQSFTGSSAKMSGTVSEDTQLFESGALPTEDGQSVTTYKDIVSLAQEMGDPSLVYRFMSLASNNAIWSSRAAFGRFGLSGVLADSSYLSENKKFYPKLFRYRFDPNPNVQRSMGDIWKALVKDSNAVTEEHFDLIMEDLLKSIVSGKEWRAREASCAAIADLIQGREMDKFEKYLDEIWQKAFKVLDDVKETVRLAAMKLCQTLTGMLVRNLSVGEGTSKRATAMVNHALPFLIQQMHSGAAKDAQQYAVRTILDLVKEAPMRLLRGFAPTILQTLINSMSSFEPESINYVHLNADKYGLTTSKIDEFRVSGISSSPFMGAIDRCLESLAESTNSGPDDGESKTIALDDAMKRIESCFKSTIGLPSKVSLSRVMVTLVIRHHAIFRPYADRFTRLTRRSVLDRNATISQSFIMALAYLVRLASEKEVRQTIQYAQKLYFVSEELAHRAVAGEIVQTIGKVSNDIFMKFASLLLPFAFLGRQDSDADVRDHFDDAWKENIGGPRALNLYFREIAELVSSHIKSNLWPIRHACCFAVSDLIKSMEVGSRYPDAEARLIWSLLEESLNGKTWEGKEKVVTALPVFVKRSQSVWSDITPQIKAIALREAKRTNPQYRPHAISALGAVASERLDLDLGPEVVPYLVEVVDAVADPEQMDVDSVGPNQERSSALFDETSCSTITCLFAVLRHGSTPDVLEQTLEIVRTLHKRNSRSVEMALCEGVSKFVDAIILGNHNTKSEKVAEDRPENAEKVSAQIATTYERFLDKLVLDLMSVDPTNYASDTEKLRLARISMADRLLATGIISSVAREHLSHVLTKMLEQERSTANRTMAKEALQRNTALLDKFSR